MIDLGSGTKIWIAAGVTDMRRGFDGSVAIRMFECSKTDMVQLLMLPRSRKAVRGLVPCRRFSFALS